MNMDCFWNNGDVWASGMRVNSHRASLLIVHQASFTDRGGGALLVPGPPTHYPRVGILTQPGPKSYPLPYKWSSKNFGGLLTHPPTQAPPQG
jgi:hypothetical protein